MAWPWSATRSTCRSPTRPRPVLTGHFYGHLTGDERTRFLAEARRVAPARRGRLRAAPRRARRGLGEQQLNNGTLHRVYKRHLTPEDLRKELGPSTSDPARGSYGACEGFESRRQQRTPTGSDCSVTLGVAGPMPSSKSSRTRVSALWI